MGERLLYHFESVPIDMTSHTAQTGGKASWYLDFK